MKFIRHLFRLLFGILSAFILLTLIYFFFAIILSLLPVNKDFKNAENGIEIYIRSNGVHTDFILPVKTKVIDWSEKIPYNDFTEVDSSFHWLGFGWGNREFYIETKEWSDLKIPTAIRAGTGIGDCAMHVEYKQKPFQSKNWVKLIIAQKNYSALVNYIYSWFKTDSAGNFIHIKNSGPRSETTLAPPKRTESVFHRTQRSGYYSNDTFYEAKGSFSIFHTCNEWIGKGLRRAGIRTGAWTPFEKSVMYQIRLIE